MVDHDYPIDAAERPELAARREREARAARRQVQRINDGPVTWGEPLGYLTDDRDISREKQRVVWITQGGNGDWYVSTTLPGDRPFHAVRICTSGGAQSRFPAMVSGIADAYRALHTTAKAEAEYEERHTLIHLQHNARDGR